MDLLSGLLIVPCTSLGSIGNAKCKPRRLVPEEANQAHNPAMIGLSSRLSDMLLSSNSAEQCLNDWCL